MKTATVPGSTLQIRHVFIGDSTSTTGAGKTALAFGDITAYYVRSGGTLTALTLVDITTLGTWDTDVTSDKLGFKKLDDTNAPGLYEIHLPDNILAAGADTVCIQLRATGTVPCNIEIQLDDVPADARAFNGTSSVKLSYLLDGTPSGSVVDDNDPDPSTTAFETDLAEATDNHYNGAFCVFYSGALAGQSRKISDYDGTTKVLTVAVAFTEAPAAGDDFLIVGRSE